MQQRNEPVFQILVASGLLENVPVSQIRELADKIGIRIFGDVFDRIVITPERAGESTPAGKVAARVRAAMAATGDDYLTHDMATLAVDRDNR